MKQIKYFNAKSDATLISDMSKKTNLDPKIVELLFSREITTEEQIYKFLNPTKNDFINPFQLSGMKEAVKRINKAINQKEKILIFGDYDVDGVSATAIMIKTFAKMKYTVEYYLPNRFTDDYGLTIEVINKINKKFSPDLIITVDCGICCAKEVEYAESLGIDVIITDHHEIPEVIPQIVINTKIENQEYPFRDLCGTGVALKLSQALLGFDESEQFLPIAAIATIADIVSLKDENRAIVATGIKLFEKYLPFGIKQLLKENKLNIKNITSTDIAFKIAPKLNSSGRMGEATDSLLLYLENDLLKIKELINKINGYNTRRQKLCNDVYEDCLTKLKDTNISNERCIILSSKKWDMGILGIVAARLVENYNRPAFLFNEKDGILKGSARSLNDINIHEMLTSMGNILETYGGHKMAAGLTLKAEYLPIFIQKINDFIFTKVSQKVFEPIYYYDLDIDLNQITDKFYEDMQKLEPFGLNNSKPLLKLTATDTRLTPLKNYPNHYTISIGKKLNLIFFNCQDQYFSLKYSDKRDYIFEIQSKENGQFKGIVKNYNGGFELGKSFSSHLDAFIFDQLNYLKNKSIPNYKTYKSDDIVKFIAKCETNPFGTIFVSYRSQSYREFTEKYYSKNIEELFVFNNWDDNGYNALSLYPIDLRIFKNYNNIIFLDPILDKSYLAEVQKYSKGEIFILTDATFNKKLLHSVNLSRNAILDFFVKLKAFKDQSFTNILHLYHSFSKNNKISFSNFYVYYLILKDLKIIRIIDESQFAFEIKSTEKTNLNNSEIYNTLNYLIQFSK